MKRPKNPFVAVALALAAAVLAVCLSESRLNPDLGSGFTVEPVSRVMFPDERRAQYHVWYTSADGVRVRLSESPIVRRAVLQTNGLVVWQENRLIDRGVFEPDHRNFVFAADASGRRAELTEWLMRRAEVVLPGASASETAAVPGSAAQPELAEDRDSRWDVRDFTPVSVQLAYWRPGITVWCTVPTESTYRVLAMQVPAKEIVDCLGATDSRPRWAGSARRLAMSTIGATRPR